MERLCMYVCLFVYVYISLGGLVSAQESGFPSGPGGPDVGGERGPGGSSGAGPTDGREPQGEASFWCVLIREHRSLLFGPAASSYMETPMMHLVFPDHLLDIVISV